MTLFPALPFVREWVTFNQANKRGGATMPNSLPQHQAVKRKRLLLAGAGRSRQDISTLLNTMGWACTAVSRPEDVFSAIQGDSFDAVLLDFSCASASAERIVLGIRDIAPRLSDKIAVISSGE